MSQGKAFSPEQRETIIQSLQPYLEMGFSRNKACAFIGLKPNTLSNWVKDDEALGMKLQGWENTVNSMVMANIVDAIRREGELEDDLRKENSKWWAERKMKDDFSTRQENTGADGKDLPTPILSVTPNVHTNDINEEDSSTD